MTRNSHVTLPETGPELPAIAVMATGVLLISHYGEVNFANDEACALLGCGPQPRQPLSDLLLASGISGGIEITASEIALNDLRLSDGRAISARARSIPGGGWVISLDDLSSLLSATEMGMIDPITMLANRAALDEATTRLSASGRPAILFVIGLERFRRITETLGNGIGDALLCKVGERLRTLAQGDDLVGRIGGDEFFVLRPSTPPPSEAEAIARRIADLIGRTYAVEGQSLNIGALVGVGVRGSSDDGTEPLIKQAQLALEAAKAEAGSTVRMFEVALATRAEARRQIEVDLRRALALKQLEVFFQPQIELESGAVAGFEALLRWRRADGSFVPPAEFVPIAEEAGLIGRIGQWVIRVACEEAARWAQPATIAVNISPMQFRTERLVETIIAALAHSGLAPSRLELEITEGALLEETENVIDTLRKLRSLGVRVSMDDFGTGYSSLSYLQKFPFDKIKIDQSFVRQVEDNSDAQAIVRTIAMLGRSLGMKIIAEGVETMEQLDQMREYGCEFVQGYLTGRPMPGDQAAVLLSSATSVREERNVG